MRLFCYALALFLLYKPTLAQNMISNGGFEDLDSTCVSSLPHSGIKQPYDIALIECILPWGEYSRTHLLFRHPDGAHGGEAVASIQLKDLSKPESHSYVIAPLCSSMVKRAHYKVMFYYRMSTNAEYTSNTLSVSFDSIPPGFNNYEAIFSSPVYTVPGFIADTGWQKAEFVYEAKGDEQLVMLGNFKTDKETPIKRLRKGASSMYVRCLVDDVSVTGIEYPDSCLYGGIAEKSYTPDLAIDTAKVYVLDKIEFEFNSAELLAASKKQVEGIAAQLELQHWLSATITGHTDSTGNGVYNKQLSTERANAVKRALIDLGIPANRLKAVGRGMEQPITHNQTETARRLNRRVEIVFY